MKTENSQLTLYAYKSPSRAERVIWMLNELELGYSVIRLDPYKGEHLTPEFLALNPAKKIPVLVHGEQVIIESLAIMEYANQLNLSKGLIPESPNTQNMFRQIVYYLVSEIEANLWVADQSSRLAAIYHWPEGTHEEAKRLVKKNFPVLFEKIGQKEFLIDDKFSMADIYAHHLLMWAKFLKIEFPENVIKYMKGLESRPAYRKIRES